jgi:hypothetical protein
MALTFKQIMMAGALSFILVAATGCPRRAATNSPPGGATAAVPSTHQNVIPDQVNTAGWDKAWTNLGNDVRQSFTPALPRLTAVEVDLVVGNPGTIGDQLTLTVLGANGRALSTVSKMVPTEKSDQVVFVIPKSGVKVTPGQNYILKLSGGPTFGWKYMVGGYPKGAATFNGRPLLPGAWSTFLFQTFGAN